MKEKIISCNQGFIGIIIVIIVVLLISGGLYFYLNSQTQKAPENSELPKTEQAQEVNNFEECVAKGYQILESAPRQCETPEGITFTEETQQEEPITPPGNQQEEPQKVTCNDECVVAGQKKCTGNGYQVCGNYDTDACLEWSSIMNCQTNAVCSNGACISSSQPACQDECFQFGLKECLGAGYKICGKYDSDSCLEWSSITSCSSKTVCQNGDCIQQKCSDGTLYNECSVNQPLYCENGNLIDKAANCGCPSGYKVNNEECISLPYTSETIIFREQKQGDILIPPRENDRWSINNFEFIKQFYQLYGDHYDFIALFPTKSLMYSYSSVTNRNIKGIGSDYSVTHSYTKKLKSLTVINAHFAWQSIPDEVFDLSLYTKGWVQAVIHEIGHHWCCYITGLKDKTDGAHWPNNLDLFSGNPNYVDLMGYYHWIIENNSERCADVNSDSTTKKFSNLTLYLMGLIPSSQVSPIKVQDFQEKEGDDHYNLWGPSCTETHQFTGTRVMSIQDIANINGERIPSYNESQKDFSMAFVILTDKDTVVPQEFIDYVNQIKQKLPEAWNLATDGYSKISF